MSIIDAFRLDGKVAESQVPIQVLDRECPLHLRRQVLRL